jgi:hypothetical protein
MTDARERPNDTVIVWRLDRFGRSLHHLITAIEELQAAGVAFVSMGENIDAPGMKSSSRDQHRSGRVRDPLLRLRRGLLGLTVLAVLWCVGIALTGGFVFQVGGVRVSSRNVWNPLLLALACAVGVIALTGRGVLRLVSADIDAARPYVRRAYARAAASPLVRSCSPALLIALPGGALQIYQWWGGRPLWVDEEMVALNIRDRSFRDLAGPLWLGQSAPLGWLAIQRGALLLLDGGERALRFVPLGFNLAMLAAAGWVGRRWMSRVAAAAFVLLCALGQWVSAYSLELKHYSADIYFALLLPALVVWAVEADGPRQRLRRVALWWAIAALGQWCANGAVLVAPASVVVLVVAVWRMDGRRTALAVAATGMVWLAVFGIHYLLAIRFTIASSYLREYWQSGMAPASAGVVAHIDWLFRQAGPLSATPGGSGLAGLLWVISTCGFLFGRPRLLALVFAFVPVSASVLALMGVVPLLERLALWVVPALYVGVALAIDAGGRWARDGYRQRDLTRAALGALIGCAGLWVCIDVAERGWRDLMIGRERDSNHALDDRAAVGWLLSVKRSGDVVLTSRLGLPAVWWYGGASIAPPASGGRLPDGTRIFEILDNRGDPRCDAHALNRALADHPRALVYLGFALNDLPAGFADFLLLGLRSGGHVTEFRRFAGASRAAVVELGGASGPPAGSDRTSPRGDLSAGCVGIRPAMRW